MTDRMLKDALTALADRAEPPADLADRALRTAARRRRGRTAAGAALAALAIAVPATFAAGADTSAPGVLGPPGGSPPALPDDTPSERAITRACLRDGPSSDFRLLTRQRVPGGQLVEVGGPRGYVLCVTGGGHNTEPPQVHPWPGGKDGGLFGFDAPLRVDGIRQVQALKWDELHAVVVGRAKPGVTRVGVAWDGGRAAQAVVHDGFFIAQTPAEMVRDDGSTDAMSSPTIRVAAVTGYDAAGEAVHTWRPKVPTERAGFVPEDCTDGLTSPRPTLCD
ncbi:hypothetical protein [Actinomadura sp. WAC 06369]|uniref:hypothetical protein n=1 Tax=Actinomadura sp. WAC 06369 TaxID=2203193 RepID=UPI000F7821C3|nr:hypothetical protein [Actinomadura sp. WAC 06369]RSN64076.1 hypothetical protein DMH08_18465 [Actinomadura sp. WAC 06369]